MAVKKKQSPHISLLSVSARWRQGARAVGDASIFILSPYITGGQTKNLIVDHLDSEVYTLFESELYISGASSLSEVKYLVRSGNSVFHLPGLHAKIVWIPNKFLTVGSQNLTSRGMRNKEATISLNHEPWMKGVELQLKRWKKERIAITMQMIIEMERFVLPLQNEYRKRAHAFGALDRLVLANQKVRDAEEQKKKLLDRSHLQKLKCHNLSATFKDFRLSRSIWATLRRFNNDRTSLVPQKGSSFLRWLIGTESVKLSTFRRYLFIGPNARRVGWARVSNGAITYFETSLRWRSKLVQQENCELEFRAVVAADHNLIFSIHGHSVIPDRAVKIVLSRNGIQLVGDGEIEVIRERWDSISMEIIDLIARPFQYGQKLSGETAEKFLEARIGASFKLGLVSLGLEQVALFADA